MQISETFLTAIKFLWRFQESQMWIKKGDHGLLYVIVVISLNIFRRTILWSIISINNELILSMWMIHLYGFIRKLLLFLKCYYIFCITKQSVGFFFNPRVKSMSDTTNNSNIHSHSGAMLFNTYIYRSYDKEKSLVYVFT